MRTSHRRAVPVTTTRTKPSFFSRLTGRRAAPASRNHAYTTTTTRRHYRTTAAPVHHQKRRPGLGDKISGALMRLKGSLTRRPGVKAAGTRRMHGTDGRGSHRAARRY